MLNRAWFRRDPVLKRAGVLLDGGAPDFAVSPLWSHGRLELVASWDRVFSFIDPGAGRLPARTGLVPLLLPA